MGLTERQEKRHRPLTHNCKIDWQQTGFLARTSGSQVKELLGSFPPLCSIYCTYHIAFGSAAPLINRQIKFKLLLLAGMEKS